jgi:hypothetical protein
MKRLALLCGVGCALALPAPVRAGGADEVLRAGFGEADITPDVGGRPVYLAGFGKDRKATRVHDPIMARAVVLQAGKAKVALASVDLVGLFREPVERVRQQLPGFTYVLVSSTHNHEGPDTLGLWGPGPFSSGIDPDYLKKVEAGLVAAVRQAEKGLQETQARIGTARAPELLHDGREPYIKHDELVALQFLDKDGKAVGVVVQWNCHPETLDSRNTEVSADFVGYTVGWLRERYRCPVVYLTGTVGGLMTSLHVEVKDDEGRPLADGTFAKTERYGQLVGQLAERALKDGKPVRLAPLEARSRPVYLPLHNPVYRLGWDLGVLKRQAFLWSGDPAKAEPLPAKAKGVGKLKLCVESEVGWLRMGELEAAAIPGEIYPELVLGRVQDPPDAGADFPDAPIEPGIYDQMKAPYKMLIGLANDELGYIIPKRQWDEQPPFCYGRKKAQYGEVNSLGPETAPILCGAFKQLVRSQ